MHNNISIPILKPNFKQTVSEKHIIQDTPASDTPKNNKKNHRTAYSITSAAIASFVIGGLIYRHNRRKKIIADLEKMSREFEEAQKKEFEKSMNGKKFLIKLTKNLKKPEKNMTRLFSKTHLIKHTIGRLNTKKCMKRCTIGKKNLKKKIGNFTKI